MAKDNIQHVVIIGAGFGGLACAKQLAKRKIFRVTLIDKQNHHLFQPLLYQVATTTLSTSDIARSIRGLFAKQDRVNVVYNEVKSIELKDKSLTFSSGETLGYDSIVIATGARTSFFGNNHWAQYVHQLKTLNDAMGIRQEVLRNLDLANQSSEAEQQLLSTVVIIGGGPTGVELAGAFSDLIKTSLKRDFRKFDSTKQRIILLEGQSRLLGAYAEDHSEYTKQRLVDLGVDVRTSTMVEDIMEKKVMLKGGEVIDAGVIIWGAGVEAHPMLQSLGVELARGGYVPVAEDLSIPGYPEAFVIGDTAAIDDGNGGKLPGVAPVAIQGAEHVARQIATRPLDASPAERDIFEYKDKGKMAIVGKGAAIVQVDKWKFQGWFAWVIWLFIHLVFLVDFRSKVGVLLSWFWSYMFKAPGSRVYPASYGSKTTKGDDLLGE